MADIDGDRLRDDVISDAHDDYIGLYEIAWSLKRLPHRLGLQRLPASRVWRTLGRQSTMLTLGAIPPGSRISVCLRHNERLLLAALGVIVWLVAKNGMVGRLGCGSVPVLQISVIVSSFTLPL